LGGAVIRVLNLAITVALLAISGAAMGADAQIPKPTQLPEPVILTEERVTYRPVSGSVVRGFMYSSDKVTRPSASLLVEGLTSDRVCIRIDSRDGSYIGLGQVQNGFASPEQITFSLTGGEFQDIIRSRKDAVILAWVPEHATCGPNPQFLVPSAWTPAETPATAVLFANSGGYTARIAVETANAGTFDIIPCEALPEDPASRIYDTQCKIDLCLLNNMKRKWLEIRNFGQRVHLEELKLLPLQKICPTR
jgi:hypothetical protein